jgi:hypothetical protein
MPASFSPGPATTWVAVHAAAMALAGILEGMYATVVAGYGGWLFFDDTEPVAGMLLGGYGMFRLVAFCIAVLTALILVLASRSVYTGGRRYLLIAGLAGLLVPYGMLFLNFFTFNCCSVWLLPAMTAIPASIVLFDAVPTGVDAPARQHW